MATSRDFIHVLVDDEIMNSATKKLSRDNFDSARGLSKFGSESVRTLYGYVGERIAKRTLGIPLDADDDNYEFDFMYLGYKMEVKTISCKFMPLSNYYCTVNSHDPNGVHKQKSDFYIFTRVLNDRSAGWILGYLPCGEFWQLGQFVKKDTTIAPAVHLEKANATVVEIVQIRPIKEILPDPYLT